MKPTHRTVTVAAVAIILAVSIPVLATPTAGLGVILLCSWLVVRQLVAAREFQATVSATTIAIEPAVSTAQVEAEIPVLVEVTRPATVAHTKAVVTIRLPAAAKQIPASERTLTLECGMTEATTTIPMSIPTAGRMQIPEPTWELHDAHGMFSETFVRGPSPTVTVDARTIDDLHVGQGGSELSAYGQHPTDGTGDGLTPAELRQYMGGDPVDRIDWKATARLPDTYVREFEPESDREVSLIFDHRSWLDAGSSPSQLAYLRELGLGIIGNAASIGDPLGFVAVGNDGLTTTISPSSQQQTYTRIREVLLDLQPTPGDAPESMVELTHPAASQQLARQLSDDDSRFGTVLRTFAEATPAYIKRIEDDALYGAVEYINSTTASQLIIILTTDINRTRLRETVRTAARGETAVLVFLAPTVLFDHTELAAIETAYDHYREFETFRQGLERHNGVVAYEVGPRDRLAAILSDSHRASRQAPAEEYQ